MNRSHFKLRNKRKNLGFTIIEIAVVLTISAILLTMASMSLSSSEKGNRDNERSADIEMLVQCLEDG
ncbi:type II secretion system protein, partial [Candidatus Saccharibacteria bacterium]|nr:type II secretion system protein [Candidatus Saccharibacteria bacterium]